MDCKWLEAEIISKNSYEIEAFLKEYLIDKYCKKYWIEKLKNPTYEVNSSQNKYGVCYCVRYRPVWVLEWILARGWWNDKGIWTADWIFNDWII